ncbi:MAG: thymidine phosphorylase [Puniceicoccales bacterium]|nr:thymidine phosphorylase [Puniceicoccales bacterium]
MSDKFSASNRSQQQKQQKKPSFAYLIEKKRDGGEFTNEEIRQIVDAIMDGEMPEAQQAALAMAIFFKQMTAQETAALAEEMKLSGEELDLNKVRKSKICKISTGGVGDKTTLILAALGAATGVIVPCMGIRDEDFEITTVAKIGALPGVKTKYSLSEYTSLLTRVGAAIVEPDTQVAPADDLLYALRQNTATLPSLPLITASILSKKLAEGCGSLVVDIKWGNGSFVREKEQAKQLARTITRVARAMERKCVALVTDSNQPIGDSVGTALEIREALQLLGGGGLDEIKPKEQDGPPDPLRDQKELVLKLGMELVRLADVAGSTLSAKQTVERACKNGAAQKKLVEILRAQGAKQDWLDDLSKFPETKYTKKLPAPKRGYVHTIDAGKLAAGVKFLATGKDGKVDPYVGITDIRKVGRQVKQGEPLIIVHYNDESRIDAAMQYFRDAYRLAPKRPKDEPLVFERVA